MERPSSILSLPFSLSLIPQKRAERVKGSPRSSYSEKLGNSWEPVEEGVGQHRVDPSRGLGPALRGGSVDTIPILASDPIVHQCVGCPQ